MKRHRAKQEEDQQITESAQVQLLRLQLEEARKKVNDAKKTNQKSAHHMVQQPPSQHNTLDLYPAPKWAPQAHYRGRPAGVTGGMRGRGRGRGGSRGQLLTCFGCGQPGHWKRDCPMQWGPWGGYTPARGGYGQQGQPPVQQGSQSYQALHVAQHHKDNNPRPGRMARCVNTDGARQVDMGGTGGPLPVLQID